MRSGDGNAKQRGGNLSGPRYRGIDHLGIAVLDLEAAREIFTKLLGFTVVKEEDVPDQQVRVVKLDAGGSDLELLAPTDSESPVAKFLAKRGAGIHHVTLRVRDLPTALHELETRGVELIDRIPRKGAGGKRIAFLHPKSTGGILIELCEAPEAGR
jgi:methylmalonyl-CoA epimerase